MVYVACDVIDGQPRVADDEEIMDIAWANRTKVTEYVPYAFYGPVQEYLDGSLSA
jgi:8-oxo-dGTP diphosphatase